MKYKTNDKEIREGYYYIISVGYCDLQRLLNYERPVAYAKGIYGWKYDVYEFPDYGNVAIVTGYNPVGAKNTKKDYEIVREYEKKAENKNKEERALLIKEFIEKMLIIN